MKRPLLIDLYCGAGGAAVGYHRAGFDVLGVDINPQPRYPYAFLQADVLKLDLRFFNIADAIHASPICQGHTVLRHAPGTKEHPNLIIPTRRMLDATGKLWTIENVEGAAEHMPGAICLCGSMFGLGVDGFQLRRHRLFQTNWSLEAPKHCDHKNDGPPVMGVYGGHVRIRAAKHGGRGTRDLPGHDKPAMARAAMGMPWATMAEMSEAIPPAYSHYVGLNLMKRLYGAGAGMVLQLPAFYSDRN